MFVGMVECFFIYIFNIYYRSQVSFLDGFLLHLIISFVFCSLVMVYGDDAGETDEFEPA